MVLDIATTLFPDKLTIEAEDILTLLKVSAERITLKTTSGHVAHDYLMILQCDVQMQYIQKKREYSLCFMKL